MAVTQTEATDMNRRLASAIAFARVGKFQTAREHATALVELLRDAGLFNGGHGK